MLERVDLAACGIHLLSLDRQPTDALPELGLEGAHVPPRRSRTCCSSCRMIALRSRTSSCSLLSWSMAARNSAQRPLMRRTGSCQRKYPDPRATRAARDPGSRLECPGPTP